MNDKTRNLIRSVCEGDTKQTEQAVRIVLASISSEKDAGFKENMLKKLNDRKSKLVELPYNLQELLVAEDVTDFPTERFIVRPEEKTVVDKLLATRKASEKIKEIGVHYVPTLLLHGESGTGKTMLAKYIAHKAGLPFIYVRFSSMVSSYLGSTQSNIAKVFQFARTTPCVLCFDEIDAVGMSRGQKNDVGEMNRIVIALMQEMDSLPNDVVIIGTTNRYDRLDKALLRRFVQNHEVKHLDAEDVYTLASSFFASCDYNFAEDSLISWCKSTFSEHETAANVVNVCTQRIIDDFIAIDEEPQEEAITA